MKKFNVLIVSILLSSIFLIISSCRPGTIPEKTTTGDYSTAKTIPFMTTQGIATPNPPSGYKRYQNEIYGVYTFYSPDWTAEEDVMGSVVAFYSPRESDNDVILDNVNIIIEDLTELPASFNEYSEEFLNQIKQFITNANIISTSETTLSGNRAGKFIFTGTQGTMNLKFLQVWAVIENKIYVLTYTADVNTFDKFLPLGKQIINNFRIEEK
jgi:serine/threonine-protein kinase